MTAPARKPLDCDHQSVCWMFRYDKKQQEGILEFCFRKYCIHDSRSAHTSAPAPEHGRFRDKDNPEMMSTPQQHTECYIDGYKDGAKTAREQEAVQWSTALNTLIATESKRKDKESVDMVYSYRVAQIIESLRAQRGGEP